MTAAGVSLLTSVYLGLLIGGIWFAWQWESGDPLQPFPSESARRRHALRNLGMLLLVVLVTDLAVGTWLLRAGSHVLDPPRGVTAALGLPIAAQLVVAFVAVDFYEYWFHRLAHRYRPLWLAHCVHHSDPHVDATTAWRHHPVETTLQFLPYFAIYLVLGLPYWIEIVRAIVVNTMLYAQHANAAFPRAIEAQRWLLMTPAVHRVHHSPDPPLVDRNFGTLLSVWDRLFGTYAEPAGEAPPEYGLRRLADERHQTLAGLVATPWRARRLATPL
jgi:sterol desaturase/sphingolipid hydroxylase (fatty acid hydroxylase superfamily)